MPVMATKSSSNMFKQVPQCSICNCEPCSDSNFRSVAQSLQCDYILTEYSSLSDAWRVYQGVALYREYRGLGGETRQSQLDVEPHPCQLCLVKIVHMAQAVFVLTTTVERGAVKSSNLASNGHSSGKDNASPIDKNKNNDNPAGKNNNDDPPASSDSVNNRSVANKTNIFSAGLKRPRRSHGRSLVDRNPDFQVDPLSLSAEGVDGVEWGDISLQAPPDYRSSSQEMAGEISIDSDDSFVTAKVDISVNESVQKITRRRRSLGRSPQWIVPAKKQPEVTSSTSKEKTNTVVVTETALVSSGEERTTPSTEKDKTTSTVKERTKLSTVKERTVAGIKQKEITKEGTVEDWRNDRVRAMQLARLDKALSSAGWSQAIRSGKNMEREVFDNSSCKTQYVAGISRLVDHFNKGGGLGTMKTQPFKVSRITQRPLTKVDPTPETKEPEVESELVIIPEKAPEQRLVKKPDLKKKRAATKTVVTKIWSKTKVNCPICGQSQHRSRLKEHMSSYHPTGSGNQTILYPCSACDYKANDRSLLAAHISVRHVDLDPENGSLGGTSSNETSSESGAEKSKIRAVRAQYQYIVKTSGKTGKQGRKYVKVETPEEVPEEQKHTNPERRHEVEPLPRTRKTARTPKPSMKLVEAKDLKKVIKEDSKKKPETESITMNEAVSCNSNNEVLDSMVPKTVRIPKPSMKAIEAKELKKNIKVDTKKKAETESIAMEEEVGSNSNNEVPDSKVSNTVRIPKPNMKVIEAKDLEKIVKEDSKKKPETESIAMDEEVGNNSNNDIPDPKEQTGTLNAYLVAEPVNESLPYDNIFKEDFPPVNTSEEDSSSVFTSKEDSSGVVTSKEDSSPFITSTVKLSTRKRRVSAKKAVENESSHLQTTTDETPKENMRPKRQKRSMEERNPDFVVDVPGGQRNKTPLKKQKIDTEKVVPSQTNEEVASPNVAKNWFDINQEQDF